MSKRTHLISAVSGLATLAALFVSGSASAARIEGFNARAAFFSDEPCLNHYWTGLINNCDHPVDVQAAANITTSGNHSPNGYTYGYAGSTSLSAWGISETLDLVSSPGAVSHNGGTSMAPTWATFASLTVYAPPSGSMLFDVILAPNQLLSYLTY